MPTLPSINSPDDSFWVALYNLLLPAARVWTYNACVPGWKNQEGEIACDIVQIAMEKIFKYLQLAQAKNIAVSSYESLSLVIAKRCFLDMRRRDLRVMHFLYTTNELGEQIQLSLDLLVDYTQEVEEKLYEEWLLAASARTIAAFSTKIRTAILVDLANRSYFDAEPTLLQQAFLAAGIRLQDYQHAPSSDPAERGRQSALRTLAYKRVAQAHAC